MAGKKPIFLRRDWNKKGKLGRKRKTKQKWRHPKGRHNKMREKQKGYARSPSIGFSAPRQERGRVSGLKPVLIHNAHELLSINKNEIPVIGRNVGMKTRIEIANKAKEKGIKIQNLNIEKFLAEIEKRKQEKLDKQKTEKEKKEEKEKKAKEEAKKAEEKKKESEAPKEKSDEEKVKEEEKEKGEKEKEKMLMKMPEQRQHEHTEAKPKQAIKAPLGRVALQK